MKKVVIYTFDYIDDVNLGMLKLSIASVRRELGWDIKVYTRTFDYLLNLSNDLIFELIELDEDDFGITTSMNSHYKRFNSITAHSRVHLIPELHEDGYDVLYLDNDTGIAWSCGELIKKELGDKIIFFAYESQNIAEWAHIPGDQSVLNAGIIWAPHIHREYFKKASTIYFNLLEKGYSFGHDQTAFTLANPPDVLLVDGNDKLSGLIHYYKEKHSSNITKSIIEELQLNEIKSLENGGVPNIYRQCQTILRVFNLDKGQKIDDDGYIFYPHLDSMGSISDIFNSMNTNGTKRLTSYSDLYCRFSLPTSGVYIKKNPSKGKIPDIIYKIENIKYDVDNEFKKIADSQPWPISGIIYGLGLLYKTGGICVIDDVKYVLPDYIYENDFILSYRHEYFFGTEISWKLFGSTKGNNLCKVAIKLIDDLQQIINYTGITIYPYTTFKIDGGCVPKGIKETPSYYYYEIDNTVAIKPDEKIMELYNKIKEGRENENYEAAWKYVVLANEYMKDVTIHNRITFFDIYDEMVYTAIMMGKKEEGLEMLNKMIIRCKQSIYSELLIYHNNRLLSYKRMLSDEGVS